MQPLVSVIVPTFNRGNLIPETIKSILDQTYKHWEMIIVDDGSEDNTKDVCRTFMDDKRIILAQRPANIPAGGNGARNYGYKLASGEFIKWLDSDDLLEPTCLDKQVKKIIEDESEVVFCRSQYFTKEKREIELGKPWHPRFPVTPENVLRDFILGKFRFSNNDGLWRKAFFKAPPYNEKLRNSQEFQMISCSLTRGASVSLQNEVLVLIREHNRRMKFRRSYGDFAKNQCLARVLIIKELKQNCVKESPLYTYLIKSMSYYILTQIRKREFSNLRTNIILLKQAVYLSFIQ